jgi:hypothetical protein
MGKCNNKVIGPDKRPTTTSVSKVELKIRWHYSLSDLDLGQVSNIIGISYRNETASICSLDLDSVLGEGMEASPKPIIIYFVSKLMH